MRGCCVRKERNINYDGCALIDVGSILNKTNEEKCSWEDIETLFARSVYRIFENNYKSLHWLHALLKSEEPVKKVIEITHLKQCNKCGEIKSRYMHDLKLADSIIYKNYVCDNCGDEVFILKERR